MNNFLNKFKKVGESVNGFFEVNPHNHWNFLLYLFSIIIIFLIIFSFYLLYEIRNDQIFQVKIDQPDNTTLLKESLMKSTVETFELKSQKINEIRKGTTVYNDPSL